MLFKCCYGDNDDDGDGDDDGGGGDDGDDAICRKQGNKLRRLMTFAWPCLLPKMCVDPATKYHGHLLLSHIIAKFAIHKRIVLQVRFFMQLQHTVDCSNQWGIDGLVTLPPS